MEIYKLSRYLGARLLTGWTAFLSVIGAEESPDYDFEETCHGDFKTCLEALERYDEIIKNNGLDAYLLLESDHNDVYQADDFESLAEWLEQDGLIYSADYED